MPKIDLASAPRTGGPAYPPPFDAPCRETVSIRLGRAAGLTKLGVNLITLAPGGWASQRHWHTHDDEFVWVMTGELVLIEDDGETTLRPGDCAAWAAGVPNGHHLVNRSTAPATFLVASNRDVADQGVYADVDLALAPGRYTGGLTFTRKDGSEL